MLLDLWPGLTPGQSTGGTLGAGAITVGRPSVSVVRVKLRLSSWAFSEAHHPVVLVAATSARSATTARIAESFAPTARAAGGMSAAVASTRLEHRAHAHDPDEELLLLSAAAVLMLTRRI